MWLTPNCLAICLSDILFPFLAPNLLAYGLLQPLAQGLPRRQPCEAGLYRNFVGSCNLLAGNSSASLYNGLTTIKRRVRVTTNRGAAAQALKLIQQGNRLWPRCEICHWFHHMVTAAFDNGEQDEVTGALNEWSCHLDRLHEEICPN